ncbi:hypothetical protein ACFL34_02075 [Candidatus Sumerlaeota bacterium]
MSKMTNAQLIDWLIEHGGPVVRYRAAAELASGVSPAELRRLEKGMLRIPLVRKWLGNLKPGRFHNGKDTDFENVMGKLLEFGLRAGMAPLDKQTAPFRGKAFAAIVDGPRGMMRMLNGLIAAGGLARAGYASDEPLRRFLLERLDAVCRTTRKAGYDIYLDPDTFGDMPKAWRVKNRPLVNPEFIPDGEFGLPYIHDLYALSAFPADLKTAAVSRKINELVRYVLAPEFQALPSEYGLLRAGKGRYYAIGWGCNLPGYDGSDLHPRAAKMFVQRVELMAHFAVARKHAWFRGALKHLEGFRAETGTYLFPRAYLHEARDSYWVSGAHMGLEEDRRRPRALELESTFRMLRIKRLAAGKVTGSARG